MQTVAQNWTFLRGSALRLAFCGLAVAALSSCRFIEQPTVRTEPNLDPGWPQPNRFFRQVSYPRVQGALPQTAGMEYAHDDEGCADCHSAYTKAFATNVHRNQSCEDCHGPASKHAEEGDLAVIFSFKGKDPAMTAEVCLKCHEQDACAEGAQWRTSKHANVGVTCISCHRAHYNVPPGTPSTDKKADAETSARRRVKLTAAEAPAGNGEAPAKDDAPPVKPPQPSLKGTSQGLGAVSPTLCYACHTAMIDLQKIAGPHQIGGPNGFNCTTCHDPHGNIKESSCKDLCLQCHTNAPTMAWHSSSHERSGVVCTDCHNPHPRACVPQDVNIDHYKVERPQRRAMSVQEPEVCYKCHPKIYGLTAMPSHHPIEEGKMVCSDCHDPHGQALGNLKEETVNLVCYKCHAEKQGPFTYEHPPVTENCTICHDPHGAVANNLLRQPTTFLCLRCHSGHYNSNRDLQNSPAFKKEMFTDCTACHTEVHGSDHPSSAGVGGRFTR